MKSKTRGYHSLLISITIAKSPNKNYISEMTVKLSSMNMQF